MSLMSIDGYHAKIEYDQELDLFRGEILGLNGGADFYGKNPKELRTEFKKSLDIFPQVCKENGIYTPISWGLHGKSHRAVRGRQPTSVGPPPGDSP